mmetsp:Transcript_18588/g.53372  ORF Transcript_18588/g.53372 Transcript_18588/m.53372 type:complete len:459 (+) Transcript_18588:465-1841(+)
MDAESSITAALARLGAVYNDPPRVSRDGVRLLRSPLGSHLRPTTSPLVSSNGDATPPVLVFSGTVAMSYKGTTYNIPVDIYLPPQYPHRPPVIFVRPTPGMMIKPNHQHVGSDGNVYMPYLTEWRAQSHSLMEMTVCLSSLFGAEPPCYAKPPDSSSGTSNGGGRRRDQFATAATNMANTFMQGVFNPNAHQQNDSGSGGGGVATPPSYDSISAGNTPPTTGNNNNNGYGQRENSNDDPDIRRALECSRIEAELADAKRKEEEEERLKEARKLSEAAEVERQVRVEEELMHELRSKLTARLQGRLSQFYGGAREVISDDLRKQTKLERGSDDVREEILELRRRKEALERSHIATDAATADINSFLRSMENDAEIPVDDLCQPSCVRSRQMLELDAKNHAISDVLYFLDRALVKGTIPLDVHLKTVRRLAKQQFMARALLTKIEQTMAAEGSGRNGGKF